MQYHNISMKILEQGLPQNELNTLLFKHIIVFPRKQIDANDWIIKKCEWRKLGIECFQSTGTRHVFNLKMTWQKFSNMLKIY